MIGRMTTPVDAPAPGADQITFGFGHPAWHTADQNAGFPLNIK
jgi:hypothetical protein